MLQFLVGVLFGIALVIFIAYIYIIDPWAPINDQPPPPIDQFRPVQIPDELRKFLKSGEDGQGISRWESCNSISLLLHMLFQEHKDTRLLRRWVHKRLQMEMNDITTRSAAGRFIQEIRIRELSLGTKFMTINSIRVEKVEMAEDQNTFEKIIFVLDIDYSGGFEMSIDVATIIAKQASLSVKITKLTGLVRVILSRQPYHHWTFSFVSQPIFETDINSQIQGHQLKKVIPVIKEAFRRSLQRKHVWPNYKIRYRPFFPNPVFQASPPMSSFSHIKMKGGIEVTVLQCSRLKNGLIDDKNKNYEVYCTVELDHRPLIQNEEQGHCVSVMLTFSRHDISTPIGLVFDKSVGNGSIRPVRVCSVEDNSLADKAAFKPGDVLVAINNVPIRSERQVTRFLQQTIGDLMVLVERSLEDIDDEELKDGEIIVNTVRDVEGFEVLGEISQRKNDREDLDVEEKEATARRRHSVSNFESSIVDTNTDSVASSVFSLDATRFEKPAAAAVQRTESARVPQLVISQPSFDLRRTQSESRLDAASKVLEPIIGSDGGDDYIPSTSSKDEEEETAELKMVGNLDRCANLLEPELIGAQRAADKDRTLTQADAAKGMAMLASHTGSVASLNSMNSTRTDTGTEGDGIDDDDAPLNRKRTASTRRTKIQATWAAGKKKMLDLMPQKKRSELSLSDVAGESIEIGGDAGVLLTADTTTTGDERKEKKKLKKKLSESPKIRPKSCQMAPSKKAQMRTTKSVQFQRDVMWGQSLHFELDPTAKILRKYLNVTVYAKETIKTTLTPNTSMSQQQAAAAAPSTPESINSTTNSETTTTSSGSTTASAPKPIVLGSVSLFIPQLIDDCNLTLSNCHREPFQLKQPIESTTTAVKDDQILSEFSRHAGFDPRLCFGDITLGFRYFADGLPSGTALNAGEESENDDGGLVSGEAGGGIDNNDEMSNRPFSPPLLSPSTTHDWKQWFGGKSTAACAMCRGKIWLRSASCCGRCLVVCHNKCVVKANQGGIVCSPHQTMNTDAQFEELSMSAENVEIGDETTLLDSPSTSLVGENTPEITKRARIRKMTDKFSNWRRSSRRNKDEVDRNSQISSTSTESSDAMVSVATILSDFVPKIKGSPSIGELAFQPGNAYNEHVIKHTKRLGREIFAHVQDDDERGEQINEEIDRIQREIRETKDRRFEAMQANGGENCPIFQELDLRLQALAVVMLHFCSALQELQSGRSTPGQENSHTQNDDESVVDEDTVTGDVPNLETVESTS